MIVSSTWLSEEEASEVLRVDKKCLELLREWGHLKPGSHWRSSSDPKQSPWKPKVFYQISECKEVLAACHDKDHSFVQIAA